jgi:uncharacterized protein YfbU (UPF0304 family)
MERWQREMMANSYRLRAALAGEDEDPDLFLQYASAYENGVSSEYHHLDLEEELSHQECSNLYEILDLFRNIQATVRELGRDEADYRFEGFDANNHHRERRFVSYLHLMGRYPELNITAPSHSIASVDIYNRMVGEWRRLGRPSAPMEESQLDAIWEARSRTRM